MTTPNKLTAVSLMSAFALAVVASGTVAAPASVSVTLGPELKEKGATTYGVAEVGRLAGDLQVSVERALARSGRYPDSQVVLVLTDARPNHPTFKQMADTFDLSMRSVSKGGAAIEGRIVGADGAEIAVAYNWYEQELHQTPPGRRWADAKETFNRFGKRLVRGQYVKKR